MALEECRRFLKERDKAKQRDKSSYEQRDKERGSLVAVLGLKQQEFLKSRGLNTVEICNDLQLYYLSTDELPRYPTPFAKCHKKEQVYSCSDEWHCSRIKACNIVRYLKEMKEQRDTERKSREVDNKSKENKEFLESSEYPKNQENQEFPGELRYSRVPIEPRVFKCPKKKKLKL
ncbi:hypothetical protein NPIL_311641 [Nephila pilipes]|uniref:Uncharacterized protein n=1 Tax=Nephila pilipes TaxID=299642 RepID=A0A8X6PNE5_NEPPI|nr:hypothetical protein NPIL_311641 [Nephila pilipes]